MAESTEIYTESRTEGVDRPERDESRVEGKEKTPQHLKADIETDMEETQAALQAPLTASLEAEEKLMRLEIDASKISEIKDKTLRSLIERSVEAYYEIYLATTQKPGVQEINKTGMDIGFNTLIIQGTRQELAKIPGLGQLTMFKGTEYKISPTSGIMPGINPTSTSFTEIGTARFSVMHRNKVNMGTRQSEGSSVVLSVVLVNKEVGKNKNVDLRFIVKGGAAFEGKTMQGLIDHNLSLIGGADLYVGPVAFQFDVTGYEKQQLAQAMVGIKVNPYIQVQAGVRTALQGSETIATAGMVFNLPERKRR